MTSKKKQPYRFNLGLPRVNEAPSASVSKASEAFLSFEAFEAPFVLLLKAFEGFQGGFEALKGGFATFVWFHFLLISFSSLLTPKSVLVWLSPFFVWRERWLLVKGVCLVSFSSYLFFFVFNPQKRSRVGGFATFVWFHFLLISFSSLLTPKSVLVWLSPFFVWRERWLLVKEVCLVSFSSCLFFFVLTPKSVLVWLSPFVWRECWLLVKRASKASKVPSFSLSKASILGTQPAELFGPSANKLADISLCLRTNAVFLFLSLFCQI